MPDGCWTVEVGDGSYYPWPNSIVSVHATQKKAVDAAHFIDLPFCQQWIDCANRNN